MREISRFSSTSSCSPRVALLISAYTPRTLLILVSGGEVRAVREHESLRISKSLLGEIESLCAEIGAVPSQLEYLAVIDGPGAFTTLRVMVTIANALHHALGIPLVPLDGLRVHEAAIARLVSQKAPTILSLVNAYNGELFYRFSDGVCGYAPAADLVAQVATRDAAGDTIVCGGEGVALFESAARAAQGHRERSVAIQAEAPELAAIVSIDAATPAYQAAYRAALVECATEAFSAGCTVELLTPRYLKEQQFKKKDA